MKTNWDDYSILFPIYGKITHVPNHQPVLGSELFKGNHSAKLLVLKPLPVLFRGHPPKQSARTRQRPDSTAQSWPFQEPSSCDLCSNTNPSVSISAVLRGFSRCHKLKEAPLWRPFSRQPIRAVKGSPISLATVTSS